MVYNINYKLQIHGNITITMKKKSKNIHTHIIYCIYIIYIYIYIYYIYSIHILNDESIPISLPPGLPLPPPSAARAAAPPPGALGRWPRPPAMFCGAANGRWTRRGARVRGSSGAPGDQGCGERVDGTLYKKRTGKSPPLKTVQLFLWGMFAMLNYQRVYDDSRMFGKSEWKLLLSWLKCVDVMIGWTVAREWL